MNTYEKIVASWSADFENDYKKGIQGIVRRLNDDKLIEYLVEASEGKYSNSKSNNNHIRLLKQELARKELATRLARNK